MQVINSRRRRAWRQGRHSDSDVGRYHFTMIISFDGDKIQKICPDSATSISTRVAGISSFADEQFDSHIPYIGDKSNDV